MCSNRVCTAPGECTCKPGYTGALCDRPMCVQDCGAHGLCEQPDTCICDSGWFDPNCTTPVCVMTCGNGGNCTAPDVCTCPERWQGPACRHPVCDQVRTGVRQRRQRCDACSHPLMHRRHACTVVSAWRQTLVGALRSGAASTAPSRCVSRVSCVRIRRHMKLRLGRQGMTNGDSTHRVTSVTGATALRALIVDNSNARTTRYKCHHGETSQVRAQRSIWVHNTLGLVLTIATAVAGHKELPPQCLMMELEPTADTHFRYENELHTLTPYARITPRTPYQWGPTRYTNVWSSPNVSAPDRQVALVQWTNVSQGVYVCANNGNCTAPDTCVCADGWIGYDCRIPVCRQGWFEPEKRHET